MAKKCLTKNPGEMCPPLKVLQYNTLNRRLVGLTAQTLLAFTPIESALTSDCYMSSHRWKVVGLWCHVGSEARMCLLVPDISEAQNPTADSMCVLCMYSYM